MTFNELKEKIEAAGVVGAGGAGFPTHLKLFEGVDDLIVNAAECEPLLYTDLILLQRELQAVLSALEALKQTLTIKRCHLAVKRHTAQILGLKSGTLPDTDITVALLPDVYPMGDEIILIYQVLGKIVPPGELPRSVGALVLNAETVYNVHNALSDIPVTEKWLTIGGNIPEPMVTRVPVGITIAELFDHFGITVPKGHVIISGGAMMGSLTRLDATVSKTTKGLLILPSDIPAVTAKLVNIDRSLKRASSACCQCSQCSELCPRALIGYPLRPHKTVASVVHSSENPEYFLNATLCCGCGVCSAMACCQGISPKDVMMEVRRALGRSKLRYSHSGSAPTVQPEREGRFVPMARLKQRIGVQRFDRPAVWKQLNP